MAKKWSEVEQSEEYRGLSDTQKQEAKTQYYNSVLKKNPLFLELSPDERISAEKQFLGYSPTETGEITTPRTFGREQGRIKRHQFIPSAFQFAGGVGGFMGGSLFGHPYLGGIAGGTGGRMVGRGIQELIDIPARRRLEAEGIVPVDSRGEKALGEFGTTLASETLAAPLGYGISKIGQGLLRTFIPRTVAERGIKGGFKPLLKPEYYEEGLPKTFSTRLYEFFNKATNKFGQAIDDILDSPVYQKMKINLATIKNSARTSLQSLGIDSVQDLDKLDVSSRDKGILMREMRNVLNMTKENATPKNLWNTRRGLDKVIYGKSWKPEAQEVLDKLRFSLNSPLRELGTDVAKAFDDYSVLMNKSDILNFADDMVRFKTTGEVIPMPKSEQFIKTLMSPEKTGLRELLTKIDPELANEMFDISSAKVLGKQFVPSTPYQTAFGKFINPKAIAQIGGFFQRPDIRMIKGATGRLVPITATNLYTEEE